MKYGRELSGSRVDEFGVCPAAEDASFDGINSGKNAGRICYAVAVFDISSAIFLLKMVKMFLLLEFGEDKRFILKYFYWHEYLPY